MPFKHQSGVYHKGKDHVKTRGSFLSFPGHTEMKAQSPDTDDGLELIQFPLCYWDLIKHQLVSTSTVLLKEWLSDGWEHKQE